MTPHARIVCLIGVCLSLGLGAGQVVHGASYPAPVEGDFVLRDFRFTTGETLPELKLHYRTLGRLERDDKGVARNAVLILHGTGGSGAGFLSDTFAGQLFGPGQLLDAGRYFLVLPDGIGHGGSSKPSDGLRLRFPRYTYDDMVAAQYRLLTEGLGVNHLALVLGTSMGGMHTWVWGETYPGFMDRLVPLASVPTQIAGRNRVMRTMIADSIRNDPDWNGGEYREPPRRGLTGALHILLMMTSSPLQWHKLAPTRDQADAFLAEQIRRRMATTDANDLLYAFDASRDYDPSPDLGKITAPVLAVNFADDLVNPPELGLMEALMPRVRRGRYVLIPTGEETRGHGTHSWPAVWGKHLEAFFLDATARSLDKLRPVANPSELSAAAQAEVRAGVEEALDAFRAASAAGDWNKVLAFYLDAPEFRWIERGHVEYRSVEAIRKSLTGFPAGTKIHTTYRDTEVFPRSADTAVVVTQFETRVAIPQSGGFRFGGTLTIDLVRRDGAWRFASGHASSPDPNR